MRSISSVLLNDLLAPLVRRMGAAVGGAAVTLGATTDQVSAVTAGVIAAIGIALDLSLSRLERKVRE